MPLLDHFHPPLHPTHRWESFHARWAVAIADALNETLPPRFFAETQVHLGSRIEADVVEFEHHAGTNGPSGGVPRTLVDRACQVVPPTRLALDSEGDQMMDVHRDVTEGRRGRFDRFDVLGINVLHFPEPAAPEVTWVVAGFGRGNAKCEDAGVLRL